MNIKEIKNSEEIKPINTGFCVYFLTDEQGEIVYIGKSNMQTLSRIGMHKKDKDFSRAFFIEIKTAEEMDEKEKELIYEVKPKYNKTILKPDAVIEKLLDEGFISKRELRKKLPPGLNFRIISTSSFKYTIQTKLVMNEMFYPKDTIAKLVEYLKGLDRCPLSVNNDLWKSVKNGSYKLDTVGR